MIDLILIALAILLSVGHDWRKRNVDKKLQSTNKALKYENNQLYEIIKTLESEKSQLQKNFLNSEAKQIEETSYHILATEKKSFVEPEFENELIESKREEFEKMFSSS